MKPDYRKYYAWATDDQWECIQMLADFYYGFHHLPNKIKEHGDGIAVNTPNTNTFATFDFNGLTRAVFMAHDRCIRFEIAPSGPGMMKLILHKRQSREGEIWERHPALDQAVAAWRKQNPEAGV